MTKTIRILSDLTINQIAAGEVIEHPASVVKELVENAIDAQATEITVEIISGGFQGIKISDNGTGMSPEDAVLSLERHATSKLSLVEDLLSLHTMGFRGEALASIAAISKMTLLTSQDGTRATRVCVEGGSIVSVGAAARAKGTTLEVLSLFYNVPARKKFQKSPSASSAEITKLLTQLSLAHPAVGITLIQQQQTIFSLPPGEKGNLLNQLKERGEQLLSADFIPSCHACFIDSPQCQGKGFIARPSYFRTNRSGQYLFINHRPVVCPCISYAIKDAYGTRLSADQYPVYLLHLFISPSLVDVNVHPQKKEVRLREESLLKYALHEAINTALGNAAASVPLSSSFPSFSPTPLPEESSFLLKEERSLLPLPPALFPLPLHLVGLYKTYAIVSAESVPDTFLPGKKEGLLFFHLPSVEKRLRLDTLLKNASTSPESQGLLFPASFCCSVAEADLLALSLPLLQQAGLGMQRVGKTQFLINALPPFLDTETLQPLLEELLSSQKKQSAHSFQNIALLLCLKANPPQRGYTPEEAHLLIGQLFKSEDPYHCPQGKPTYYYLSDVSLLPS